MASIPSAFVHSVPAGILTRARTYRLSTSSNHAFPVIDSVVFSFEYVTAELGKVRCPILIAAVAQSTMGRIPCTNALRPGNSSDSAVSMMASMGEPEKNESL